MVMVMMMRVFDDDDDCYLQITLIVHCG